MHVKHFEDLEIWKEARRLTNEIYCLTSAPKFAKDFGLRGQIQSAATSVMSNIAEGFESRESRVHSISLRRERFLRRSPVQLYVAVDQRYISATESAELLISFKRLSSMIGSLINYLKRSGMKGAKYNSRSKTSLASDHTETRAHLETKP